MLIEAKSKRVWSDIGLKVLIGSVIIVFAISLADGALRGNVDYADTRGFGTWAMLATWMQDFRYAFEQLIYVGAIIFVGAKFIETRTLLTVGFDNLNKDKVRINGPDQDNIVWIGHRYANALEAEAVAETFRERLRQSA